MLGRASAYLQPRLLESKDVRDAYERVGTYVAGTNPQAFGDYISLESRSGEVWYAQ